MSFDIVEEASAELVLIIDALGFHELVRSRTTAAARLPIVTLDSALSMIADCHFSVVEAASWSSVAALLQRGRADQHGEVRKQARDAAPALTI